MGDCVVLANKAKTHLVRYSIFISRASKLSICLKAVEVGEMKSPKTCVLSPYCSENKLMSCTKSYIVSLANSSIFHLIFECVLFDMQYARLHLKHF